MNDLALERYKAALRAGHVAMLRGQLDDAADAYREAIDLGPDRAVPRAALGGVHLRLGDPVAALEAYDGALARAPDDDAAILGRAQALVVLRRPAEAALTYDRLAEVRAAAGRSGEACDALRRSLEIEPTRGRRRRYMDLARELRLSAGDAEAELALGRALRLLEQPEGGPEQHGQTGTVAPAGEPEPVAVVAEPPPPPPDGEALAARGEEAEDRGDIGAAREAAMAAARAHRAAGHPVAAIDACLRVLPIAPGDRELHLLLAELQADRGWTAVAAEKLRHLARLAELDGDHEAATLILGAGRPADAPPAVAEPGPG